MKESIEFLLTKTKELFDNSSDFLLSLRYQYIEYSNVHYVELIFKNGHTNKELINKESEILREYNQKFDGGICFFEKGTSLVEIDKPLYDSSDSSINIFVPLISDFNIENNTAYQRIEPYLKNDNHKIQLNVDKIGINKKSSRIEKYDLYLNSIELFSSMRLSFDKKRSASQDYVFQN